jgi:hypothetical protein
VSIQCAGSLGPRALLVNFLGLYLPSSRRINLKEIKLKNTPWPEFTSELSTQLPPQVGEVSAKFEDRGCRVASITDPYGRILDFLDRKWN